jgi:hypothetical protein
MDRPNLGSYGASPRPNQCEANQDYLAIRCFHRQPTSIDSPVPSISSVDGSGTVWPDMENAALNGPWWVTSVPMRSQSGARVPAPSLRVQLCRSAAKGVPGATS